MIEPGTLFRCNETMPCYDIKEKYTFIEALDIIMFLKTEYVTRFIDLQFSSGIYLFWFLNKNGEKVCIDGRESDTFQEVYISECNYFEEINYD